MTQTTEFTTDPMTLVSVAAEALLTQQPVSLLLSAGWERPNNFPLPIKREPAGTPQGYRPLAILEWVDAELRGENRGRAMTERHAAAKAEVTPAAGHVEDILAMVPPQHAPIEAVLEGLASGKPAEPVALAASAPAGVAMGSSVSDAVDAPATDPPTQAERMASAYAAGLEIARQGRTRWSVEFLDANAAALRGLRGAAADEVHAEMLRGLENGQPIPRKPELRQPAEAAAARRAIGGKPVAMYRNPVDGASWSGRGLKPKWLVEAIEAGRTQDEFMINTQGAQA